MKKKIVALALCMILLGNTYVSVMAVTQAEINEVKEKKEEIENQKAQVEEELSSTLQEITKLDASISEISDQIDTLNDQITKLEDAIEESQKKLDKKEKEHKDNTELMEDRLVVMYETGENTFLDLLFNSESIVEFISSYYTLSQITQSDKELLETIEKEQDEIKSAKTKLETDKAELDSAKAEKETKNNLLKTQKNAREEKANSLSEEEKTLEAKIEEYQAEYDRLEQQRRQEIAEASRRAGGDDGATGLNFDGTFIWPCDDRYITSGAKARWGRWHKGIDIGAYYEPVYAAASGYAYTLYDYGGYGNYIIIVHGNGWCTLYGHLDSYNVEFGEYVSQGEVIATSGNTGGSQGPHLHFEIRQADGLSDYFSTWFENPLDYLSGGWSAADDAFVES